MTSEKINEKKCKFLCQQTSKYDKKAFATVLQVIIEVKHRRAFLNHHGNHHNKPHLLNHFWRHTSTATNNLLSLHFIVQVRTEKKGKNSFVLMTRCRESENNSYHLRYSLVFAQEYLRQPIFFLLGVLTKFSAHGGILSGKKDEGVFILGFSTTYLQKRPP